MKKDKMLDLGENKKTIRDDLDSAQKHIAQLSEEENYNRREINELIDRIQSVADQNNAKVPKIQKLDLQELDQLNVTLDNSLHAQDTNQKYFKFPKLSSMDVVISSVAGLIAAIIDILLVGTPEVVKIYKGGEHFDGSIITTFIRKLNNGPIEGFGENLSKICKVPYDISAIEGGMYPQNHRLRSLSHDPFFGLFFAVFDIIMGTTTYIDDTGNLRIVESGSSVSMAEKALAIFYYIGHIISDLFTARGIPIPGAFLTQFFTYGDSDKSIAKIAEDMYTDGYDMRHLASMNVPILAKNIIIDAYLTLMNTIPNEIAMPVAEKEKVALDAKLRKEKMEWIANSIAIGGNTLKFFSPTSCCNPCSLNAAEWFAFLRSSIVMLHASTRDSTPETVICNRQSIDAKWDELIK